jgi:Flp pilus assembly protein TadD
LWPPAICSIITGTPVTPDPAQEAAIPDRRDTLTLLIGTLTVTIATLVVVFSPPGWRTWGLDGLATLPAVWRWWWPAAAALSAAAIWWVARRGRPGMPVALLAMVGLVVVAVVAPTPTLLRGDGQFLVTGFSTPATPHEVPVHAYLADRLVTGLLNAGLGGEGARAGTVDPLPVFRLLGALSALLYAGAWVLFARRFAKAAARYLCLAAGFLGGALPILAGLVEFYAPVQALTAVSLVLATGALARGRYPWWGLAVALLAAAMHFSAAIILPAFVLPALHRYGRRVAWAGFAGVVAAGLIGVLVVGNQHLMPPLGPAMDGGYRLLDPRHALDLVNLLFWSAPVLLAVILPLALRRHPESDDDGAPVSDFLGAAALVGLGFALLFAPELGMARDADLLSLFAIPATMWGLWRIRSLPLSHNALLPAAAVWVGLLTASAQVAVQAGADTAVARFERQLERNQELSGYGWEILSIHHRKNGDTAREEQALRRAFEAGGNTRFHVHLAYFAAQRGDMATAEHHARAAVQAQPDLPDAHGILGIILENTGRADEAVPALREAVRLGTRNGECFTLLAYHLGKSGNLEEAGRVIQLAETRASRRDGKFHCVAGMLAENLGRPAEAVEHYRRALGLKAPSPWRESAERGLQRLQQP